MFGCFQNKPGYNCKIIICPVHFVFLFLLLFFDKYSSNMNIYQYNDTSVFAMIYIKSEQNIIC
jgi:hypothetical protein